MKLERSQRTRSWATACLLRAELEQIQAERHELRHGCGEIPHESFIPSPRSADFIHRALLYYNICESLFLVYSSHELDLLGLGIEPGDDQHGLALSLALRFAGLFHDQGAWGYSGLAQNSPLKKIRA